MAGFIRLFVILIVGLSIVYLVLSLSARRAERARLMQQFIEEGHAGEADVFVRAGMARYETSLRRKLLLGVYVIPLGTIATIVYVTNLL